MNPSHSMLSITSNTAPYLPIGEPGDRACDERPLQQAHEAILAGYPKMRSFLIIRGGRLILEHYYGNHHAGALNDLRSATKSFTSVLAGIAISRGEMPDVDTPVIQVLGQYIPAKTHPLLPEVTLRHLLTMTSGFAWQTGKKLGEPLIHRFHRSRKWTSFALSLPVVEKQMGVFQYRSTDSHLISVILSETTGKDVFTYARELLFDPLDIRHAAWSPSPEGHSMGHVGLYLTSRDMAKFGLCCLNGGRWLGQQLIPDGWLKQAHSAQSAGYPAFGDYGFQWWIGKCDSYNFTCAHGHGGQQIYIFPELDAVIVFTADSKVSRWKNPRMLLERYILKSMRNSD